MKRIKFLAVIFFAACLLNLIYAQTSKSLSYQGLLTDSNGSYVSDGNYSVIFNIYDHLIDGRKLWTENQDVVVQNGIFNVNLGSKVPLNISFDKPLFLGITINEEELTPRIELTGAAFSFNSFSVEDSTITTDKIKDNAVTSNKISKGEVVKTLNNLTDDIVLEAGENISILNIGNKIRFSASGGSGNGISSIIAGSGLTGGGGGAEVMISLSNPLNLSGNSEILPIISGKNEGNLPGVQGENKAGTLGFLGNNLFGVYGKHPGFGNNGEYYGVLGGSVYGARGTHQLSFNTGFLGTTIAGVEAIGNSGNSFNYGYLGGRIYGAYGEHDSTDNYGILGSKEFGVFGENGTGNFAAIAGSDVVVHAHNVVNNTEAVLGTDRGVYGEHLNSGNYGYLGGSKYGVSSLHHETNNSGRLSSKLAAIEGWAGIQGSPDLFAAYLVGTVEVHGKLTKSSGSFKIDHPLDPENKYLSHSFVESPDMMNIYNGNIQLDANGQAQVSLPEWFQALNIDYRYQLTPVGMPGPDLYIAQEITDNKFRIAGGQPYSVVSWQVTGIRNDAYAKANRIQVEEYKKGENIGKYLNPKEHGKPENLGINYRPKDEIEMTKNLIYKNRNNIEEERRKNKNEKQFNSQHLQNIKEYK